jgi:serine/threonine protein kinase
MSGQQPHSASSEALDRMPKVGETIAGRYRLVDQIASGGMGVIMLAEQLSMERDVAVKLLHPHMAEDPDTVRRFQREVQLAKQLAHPNVIQVFDVGRTDHDVLFLVMEFLDGRELKETLRDDAPLTIGRAVDIISQTLDGLAEAHDHGVIHRDLKPSNIFLLRKRRGDHVKLLDFGIAKSLESDNTALTKTGQLCGTANYMPPETFLQSSPGPAGDVYAAGLIFLEMLTGRRTVAGDSMPETVMLHLKHPIELPPPIADSPLGDVIAHATAKHPEDRYSDADAMLDALERVEPDLRHNFRLSTRDIPSQDEHTSLGKFDAQANLSVLRDAPSHEVGGQDCSPPETPAPHSPSTDLDHRNLPNRRDELDDRATEFLEELADESQPHPDDSSRTVDDASPTSPTTDPPADPSDGRQRSLTDRLAALLPHRTATISLAAITLLAVSGGVAALLVVDPSASSTTAATSGAASVDDTVDIRIETQPKGAVVLRDGHSIGQTPIEQSVDRQSTAETWTIKKPGFAPRDVQITPDGHRTFSFQLQREDTESDDQNVQVFRPGDMKPSADTDSTTSSPSPTRSGSRTASPSNAEPTQPPPSDRTESTPSTPNSEKRGDSDTAEAEATPAASTDDSTDPPPETTADDPPEDSNSTGDSDDDLDQLFEQNKLKQN